MNKTISEGNWNRIKGKLKEKYAKLTDNDLLFAEGKMDQVIGTIQKKVGETREAVDKFINEHVAKLSEPAHK